MKSPFKEDHTMVFMGGFAAGTTTEELKEKLEQYNAKMVRCSGISYRNYGWSFVTLATSEQADRLVKNSPIVLRDRNIDIRPFINRTRVRNHMNNRPTDEQLIERMVEILKDKKEGLSVAQMQTTIFHIFQ